MISLNAYCMQWHLKQSDAFLDMLVEPLKPYIKIKLNVWEGNIKFLDTKQLNDPIIFCQIPPPVELLKNSNIKFVWLPMWDNVRDYPQSWWNKLPKTLRVVAFSNYVAQRALQANLPVLKLKFFKNPDFFEPVDWNRGKVLFYWNRVGLISVKFLYQLCKACQINKIILQDKMDPDITAVPLLEIREMLGKTIVERLPDLLPRSEFLHQISEANIQIAPRMFEGVGMTFLEGMARGCAVLATNTPTMNEYIIHKRNGYLFSPRLGHWPRISWIYQKASKQFARLYAHPFSMSRTQTIWPELQDWEDIAFVNFRQLGGTARTDHQAGFVEWQKQISSYARFILEW